MLVAHGSPDDRHRRCVQRLAGRMTVLAAVPVSACYLEHDQPAAGAALCPPLPTGIEPVVSHTVVLPLLLTAGFHWRSDVPALVGHNGSRSTLLAPPEPARFRDTIDELVGNAPHVVIASAGSSRPEVVERFQSLATLLGSPGRSIDVALSPGAVAEVARPGTVVVPALAADGIFADRIRLAATTAGASTTAVLGDTDGFAATLTDLVTAAL